MLSMSDSIACQVQHLPAAGTSALPLSETANLSNDRCCPHCCSRLCYATYLMRYAVLHILSSATNRCYLLVRLASWDNSHSNTKLRLQPRPEYCWCCTAAVTIMQHSYQLLLAPSPCHPEHWQSCQQAAGAALLLSPCSNRDTHLPLALALCLPGQWLPCRETPGQHQTAHWHHHLRDRLCHPGEMTTSTRR